MMLNKRQIPILNVFITHNKTAAKFYKYDFKVSKKITPKDFT